MDNKQNARDARDASAQQEHSNKMLAAAASAAGNASSSSTPTDELSRLGTLYGTDKVHHRYTRFYHRLFEHQRHTLGRFLEVGVYRGASMHMWKEYFTNAELYGLDSFHNQVEVLRSTPAKGLTRALRGDLNRGYNFTERVQRGELGSRVHVIDANQSEASEMAKVVQSLGIGTMDLIIEDGSHQNRDQQLNLAWLFPLLRPKSGVYIIEDLTSSFQGIYDERPRSPHTTFNVMRQFNKTRRMESRHMSAEERCYLERWVASAELNVTRRSSKSILCVLRRYESPRPSKVCTTSLPAQDVDSKV